MTTPIRRYLAIVLVMVVRHRNCNSVNGDLELDATGTQCVALDNCQPYLWLLQNPEVISRGEVLEILKERRCGYEGIHPKVECEIPQVDDFGDAGGEQTFAEDHSKTNRVDIVPRGGFTHSARNVYTCRGTLTFYHTTPKNRALKENRFSNLKVLTLKGRKYFNLGRKYLKNRVVHNLQVDGNCCWMLYSKPLFNGRGQLIEVGSSARPEHQPKSIRQAYCL